MGGVDADNATAEVLRGLAATPGAGSLVVTVVMGGQAPWLGEVQQLSQSLALDVTVLVDVSDMASLMAQADLAIGAAGATAWERCCLGLPTLMAVLADNQRLVAEGLRAAGAVQLLPAVNSLAASLPDLLEELVADPEQLRQMSRRAAALVDGGGARRVVETMEMMS
ncbi:glycosyltransferase [Halopseudomonas pachastrellae]|nr:glycosyltransferase [Halopseudomonas pachastrellae]